MMTSAVRLSRPFESPVTGNDEPEVKRGESVQHVRQLHGFKASHSCETQQLLTTLSSRDRNIQIDAAVLDFSKAFDKVPHKRLLSKLQL